MLILVSAGIFWGYIDPAYQNVKALQATKAEYDSAIEKSEELLKLRDDLLDKYNSLKGDDLKRIEKLLPTNIDNVRMIIDVNGITSKYGASLKNVKVSTNDEKKPDALDAVPSKAPYNSMLLNFTVNAKYENFLSILADIEKSLRVMDVASISFKSGESDVYEYNVGVRTYWLK